MSARAERRRAEKAAAKTTTPFSTGHEVAMIRLENPVAQHYATWIAGNATICQRVPPHPGACKDFPDQDECCRVVEQDSATGQHIVICGAGPSLNESIAEYAPQADQLWGCNSALTYLYDRGYPVTHGFAVDQTPEMCTEWASTPPVEYLISSTVHPHLTQMLVDAHRRTRFFHNFVGIKERPVMYEGRTMAYEDWLYAGLYPGTVRAGSGLNAVTRAIDVAYFMGARAITVLGADCALRASKPMPTTGLGSPEHHRWLTEDVVMHADGGHALTSGATAVTMSGEIDGRTWVSKPDMLISAVCLTLMERKLDGLLRLVGDTLPVALRDKDDEFLKRLPSLVDNAGKHVPLA